MRTRWIILLALAAAGPAAGSTALAQEPADTGVRTETQERLRSGPPKIDWVNLIGVLGLLGLLGLRGEHVEDSYHPAAVD